MAALDAVRRSGPLRRLDWSAWLALGVFGLGLVLLATGLVPAADADATLRRIAPILVFLFAVLILAELAARAEFFDVLAARMAIVARGSYPALFGLAVALAASTTMILNLDTTAVLLTPVMLAVAARAGIAPLPLAMTTIWLANTASLLLPVSNLTNLLAADRVGLPVLGFAERMALPQLAALAATAACLWFCYWRRGLRPDRRYSPPPRYRPRDRVLFRVAAVTCGLFVVGILVGVPIAGVSVAGAVVLLVAFAVRDRAQVRWALVPWRLLALVSGMFLIVDAVGRLGLSRLLAVLVGVDPGVVGVWRSAATGGVLANLINNLPAYVAAEAVVPLGHTDQLLGLLIGTNAGPLVLPWASLATLLWLERCRAAGLSPRWPRFLGTGALTAVVTVAAAVTVLLLER
ncbi:SLC13 family permease [Micromonospora sp. NBC_01699]|uniref:SLC13 family permease n=1 Tax=Micromonospora sp. NBC_01699 TaxID=2975984 RepID=UPI002E2CA325|nr:SLC13 family permease [Micromonospora sp. NBC_01699]